MSADGTASFAAELRAACAQTPRLITNAALAGEVKRYFVDGELPQIVPLPRLTAAAAALPALPFARLLRLAALPPPPAAADEAFLKWRLYDYLAENAAGVNVGLVTLAGKLARLFMEMDESLPLDADGDPFAALSAAGGEPSFEASVAAAAWPVAREYAPLRRRQLLADVAAKSGGDFVAVVDEDTPPAEDDFYRRSGATILHHPQSETARRLAAALKPDADAGFAPPDLTAYEGAGDSLNETAGLALLAVRRLRAQTADGAGGIGVAVYDRLLARRFRAVAEADGIIIKDNIGWRGETLSAGAALRAFAAAAVGGFAPAETDKYLQAPFFARRAAARRAALLQWRRLLANSPHLPASYDECRRLAPAVAACLRPPEEARRRMPAGKAAASAWLKWLRAESADMLAAWQNDAAMTTLFQRLRANAAAAPPLSAAAFCLWLDDCLASQNFAVDDAESDVELVPPTTRRRFAALLLLGYTDEDAKPDGWLGEAERDALGLPNRAKIAAARRRNFCRLLAEHNTAAAVWQGSGDTGETRAPHAFWRLTAMEAKARGRLYALTPPPAAPAPPAPPPPAAAVLRRWPQKLNVSAADSLMHCPYQFYAANLLRLADDESDDDDPLAPRFTGALLHRILRDFAEKLPPDADDETMTTLWRRLVEQHVAGSRPETKVLREHWQLHAAALFDWQRARQKAGWRAQAAELKISAQWPAAAQNVQISGRIDRLEQHTSGFAAVVDYKSGAAPAKKDLLSGERPQLPLYAYLYAQTQDAPVAEQWLCRLIGDAKSVWQKDTLLPPARMAAHVRGVLRQIDAKTPMPANGGDCTHCRVAGVCRRPHWQTSPARPLAKTPPPPDSV